MSITNRVHHIVSVAGVSPHLGKLFIREIILLILPKLVNKQQQIRGLKIGLFS